MLTDVLRNRFGLSNGYIGSDSGNVYANAVYGVAADAADAAVMWPNKHYNLPSII